MLTQCPTCETIYRIQAADLGSAQGFVECGECGARFNALERIADEPKFTAERTSPAPDTAPITAQFAPSGPAFVLLNSDHATGPTARETVTEPSASTQDSTTAGNIEPVGEDMDQRGLCDLSHSEHPSAAEDLPVAPTTQRTPIDIDLPTSSPQTLSESEHAILFSDPHTDFGDEAIAEIESVDLDDVPSVLKAEVAALSQARRGSSRWLWRSFAALFIVGLVLQFSWVYRVAIVVALPETGSVYRAVCKRLGCRVEAPGAASAIELISRDVRDHPQYRDTLLVNATLLSRSAGTTAYPTIELGLYGPSGEAIGIRRFEPHEYLDKSIDLAVGMPPNRPVYIVMELVGLSHRAVSFEFTFL